MKQNSFEWKMENQPEQNDQTISLGKDIFEENDRYARRNRKKLHNSGIRTLNIVGSPGSGKTTLLEATIRYIKDEFRIAVIEGDVATDNDKLRIEALGVKAHQIITNGACHLDAKMVHDALHHLPLDERCRLLIIENVGNLICPTDFDLGEDFRVVVLSVPEGDDKPEKYPHIFHSANVIVISKIDLLPYIDFDIDKCKMLCHRVNPKAQIFVLSAKTNEGFEQWIGWIKSIVCRPA